MNFFENPDTALQLLDTFAEFDYVSMCALICTMIDTTAAKYNENAVDVATLIRDNVKCVNDNLGPYHISLERGVCHG